ncbi:hypothetical protein BT69DRAFT_671685 [Atractiella rhizophila]|nr:hypothetical protein BT69DRAFT_671685 [Atractiella rhizophila]
MVFLSALPLFSLAVFSFAATSSPATSEESRFAEDGILVNFGLMVHDEPSPALFTVPASTSNASSHDEELLQRDGVVSYDGRELQYGLMDEFESLESHSPVARSIARKKSMLRTLVRRASDVMNGAVVKSRITWYSGQNLRNPYCWQQSKWQPTDSSMIAAVTLGWKNGPDCGTFITLTDPKSKKSVLVRVVDMCASCSGPWADLSKSAFKKLFSLDVEQVDGLLMKKVSPPKEWDTKKYGPKKL